MSATLYYRPLSKNNKYLKNVMAPSSFMSILNEVFQSPPYKFTAEDIPVLRGMSAASRDPDNGFKEIIQLIETIGDIEVWPEY